MADGFNGERVVRFLQLLDEYRDIQNTLSQIDDQCHPYDYYLRGYAVLRQCKVDGLSLLEMFQSTSPVDAPNAAPEIARTQLRQIVLDASARRFRANKICLEATAATRWVNLRNSILQGQRPHVGHAHQLMHCDQAFEAEMATITDNQLYNDLCQKDAYRGLWVVEDPPLQSILQWIEENC